MTGVIGRQFAAGCAILIALLSVACRRDPPATAAANGQPVSPASATTTQSFPASAFPGPDRRVASIVTATWDNEDARDRVGEADTVMSLLGIGAGMGVADIGAGSGYYTVRLSPIVGPTGRVYAEDITPGYIDDLRQRIRRDNLNSRARGNDSTSIANVDIILGTPDDPRLPAAAVDRALFVHMYHEIEQPYALMYNLFPALKLGARVGVVDVDKPTSRHGTPPALLKCEMAAAGYDQVEFHSLAVGYLAVFAPVKRSSPDDVRAAIAKPGFSGGRC